MSSEEIHGGLCPTSRTRLARHRPRSWDDPATYLRIAAWLATQDVNIHARAPAKLSVEEVRERFLDLCARADRAVQDRAAQVTHADTALPVVKNGADPGKPH